MTSEDVKQVKSPRGYPMLLTLLAAAFVIRVAVTLTAYYPTIDSGTVGLMACHILEGERPLYFYGQQYMGALEAYVAAFFVSWMGPGVLAVGLAPIFFSLCWLVAAWALVREVYGARAAVAAAAILAVPSWHVLWYSIGTYGGYPAAWFLATCGLYLMVRQWNSSPGAPGTLLRFAGLGLCSGLGIWTNPQSVMILAVAWIAAAVYVIKYRSVRDIIGPVILCTVLTLASASPVLLTTLRGTDSGMMTAWSFDGAELANRVKTFLLPGLHTLVWSREEMHPAWSFFTAACVVAGVVLLALSLVHSPTRRDLLRRLAPAALVASCILFALPHDMADERAPRYLILLWASIAVWIFAVPIMTETRTLRRAAYAVLVSWIVLQAGAILTVARDKHTHRVQTMASRDLIADASRSLGHPYIYLVGGVIFGHRSQPWNFHAGGSARFLSCFDERHRKTSAEAEFSTNYALACEPNLAEKLSATLDDLDVEYSETETGALKVFHTLTFPPRAAKSIPPAKVTLVSSESGESVLDTLCDRNSSTIVSTGYVDGAFLDVDLGSSKSLDSLTMFSPHWFHDDLPTSFQIERSVDGRNYTLFKDVTNRFSAAYRLAGRMYVKGYFGCMETSLHGLTTRYLRIRPRAGASAFSRWSINELYVFESVTTKNHQLPLPDVNVIAEIIRNRNLDFVYSDRAQSAGIIQAFRNGREDKAFPRYNPKFPDSLISREVIPSPGKAILVDQKYAEECATILDQTYGREAVAEEVDLGTYKLLLLGKGKHPDDRLRLFWNGHTLMKADVPPRWH